MKQKILIPLIAALLFGFAGCKESSHSSEIIKLENNWKFTTGDNPEYAKPQFDDSGWSDIKVDKTWNKQGYKKYEGFAWYRTKIVIPSSLKNNAELKDSLIFNLGRIDDFDQVFLNGVLIGENLQNVKRGTKPDSTYKDLQHSYWDVNRRYSLPSTDTLIKWNDTNVIAIRVYDWGVAGGIYSGDLNITMPQYSDYLKIDFEKGHFSTLENKLKKTVKIKNTSAAYTLKGEFEISVTSNISDEEYLEKEFDITLPPKAEKDFTFSFDKPKESTQIEYSFEFENDEEIKKEEGVPYILTPPTKKSPQINGALIYGERVNKPFLYKIAVTGERPVSFSATGLPEGLHLDKSKGIISGKAKTEGKYLVTLVAENNFGKTTKVLEIVIGNTIALTPPMGWNSWNVWGLSVTQQKVYDAAKAFADLGLADHGWTYINIDDGWEIFGKSKKAKRNKAGEILTNEKFPDMKKLGDDIHALGLKFGIYSSPGPLTCGGYTASLNHEFQDAKTFAKWGIDYLKYDLCSYRSLMKDQNSPEELMPPYMLMNKALQSVNRDIVYSICEYGNGKVWEWGEKVGGNLWRTTGDIWDDWERMYQIGFGQTETAKYAGPGHWNDPDMLVLGMVGWGPDLHRTSLTPDEQYTHVSLWALLSAPLLLGCDLTKMDDFTMNLITNDEVLAIDQDKLGNQAVPVIKNKNIEVWKKNLADGNIAFGIFNISDKTKKFKLSLEKLGITDEVLLRDVWRQKNIGKIKNTYKSVIPSHGVVLIKTLTEK